MPIQRACVRRTRCLVPPRKRTARARKPKAYCKGIKVNDGACAHCYRDVRITKDGVPYKHYAKAPVNRTDPRHSKYIFDTYGITGEQYEAIIAHQGGVCFICEKAPKSKRLAVDHCHITGEVRGALCRRCNHRLLGSAHDATRILERAIEYLNNPPARAVLK